MSMFSNAQNTNAQGSTFNQIGHDQFNIGQVVNTGASLEELLQKYIVPDAAYNCRGTRVGCLDGTRQAAIENIMDWVTEDDARQICWLYAPAGFGKSALAQTLAEMCVEREILAASFFFKRGAGDRARINGLIPTLSYHLTLSLPETKLPIRTALQSDLTILHQSLEDQLMKLLINPISAPDKPIRRQNGRMIVIIDALDECDDKHDIAELIEILLRTSRDHQLPFLFLVTGRAEPHIFEKFSPPETHSTTYSLGLQEFDAHSDIRTFLQSRFSKILREKSRLMREVQQPWPSDTDIEALVKKSSGLFIFASTLIDFITDGRGAPQAKLESVLKTHNGLDPLYTQVFSAAPRDDPFDAAIGTVTLLREQLSITDLACLLRRPTAEILHALLGIQSILRIPEENDKPIELIHESLQDFLTDRSRSEEYFITPASRHAFIAIRCVETMGTNSENELVAQGSIALYACRHWSYHLDAALMEGDRANGGNTSLHPQLIKCVQDFKAQSLKYWINTVIHLSGGDNIVEPLKDMISRSKQLGSLPKPLRQILKDVDMILEKDIKSFGKFQLQAQQQDWQIAQNLAIQQRNDQQQQLNDLIQQLQNLANMRIWDLIFRQAQSEDSINSWRHYQASQSLLSRAMEQLSLA